MTLRELIEIADEGYSQSGLFPILAYHEDPESEHGDTLAKWIALELANTYDAEETDEGQLSDACDAILSAADQLQAVHDALSRGVQHGP